MVRVRFAPSPTGIPHVGNIRTAIFNWLFAKKELGKFFIRIEDTDLERSKKDYEDKIFEILQWFQLDYEPEVIRQSDRFSIYREYAEKLLGINAYYCDCHDEICLCKNKNYKDGAIRFNVPNKSIKFNDLIFGELGIKTEILEDFVLLRKDKTPTYMLCVVIDDYLTNISHVLRGEDHKTNTFKQLLLYEALGWTPPKFGHFPMIIGEDRKKLSKRNGNVSMDYYINEGFLPSAMFNFLLKLGFGYKNEEIISKNRALEIFNLENIRKSPALFDIKKLNSFSLHYMKEENLYEKFLNYFSHYLEQNYNIFPTHNHEILKPLYEIYKIRSSTLKELSRNLEFIYISTERYDKDLVHIIQINKEFSKEEQNRFRATITNNKFFPSIHQIIDIFGKDWVINRLNY